MLLGELDQYCYEANARYYDRFHESDGIYVVDEAWDNLLILDGCRVDLYEQRIGDDSGLETVTSRGSESWEFMQENFVGRQLHDTVYVHANPHACKLPADTFHHVENLLGEWWDPDLETVRPDAVATVGRRIHEQYPNKRLILHFMQPHFPFIGETGRQLDHGGIGRSLEASGNGDGDGMTVWGQLKWGTIDRETVWQAYRENLDLVLETVRELVPDLSGRTVVTSDHGNLFGERLWPIPGRGYGHPSNLHVPALVEVPWHVHTAGDRRQLTSEPPQTDRQESLDEEVVTDRLRSLGYR